MKKKIYILHEYGSPNHYRALQYMSSQSNDGLVFREFSVVRKLIKSILTRDIKLLSKQFTNMGFIFSLFFTKGKCVVLGIAPYDIRLLFLMLCLKGHKVYYHTSWSSWGREFYPKKLLVNTKIIMLWEKFLLTKVDKIFVVSEFVKKEMLNNMKLSKDDIVPVYHSIDPYIYKYKERSISNKFLFVGRLESSKGIDEILSFFAYNKRLNLTIVGKGLLEEKVKSFAHNHSNITYEGFVSCQIRLAELYNENTFLLLNSKRNQSWEELFGMVIIEAMACGLIPITTDHSGPCEIIENGSTGFLSSESEYVKLLETVANMINVNPKKLEEVKTHALYSSRKYHIGNISRIWNESLPD